MVRSETSSSAETYPISDEFSIVARTRDEIAYITARWYSFTTSSPIGAQRSSPI